MKNTPWRNHCFSVSFDAVQTLHDSSRWFWSSPPLHHKNGESGSIEMTNNTTFKQCFDTVDLQLRGYFDGDAWTWHPTEFCFKKTFVVVVVGGLGNEVFLFLFNFSEMEKHIFFWNFWKKSSQKSKHSKAARNWKTKFTTFTWIPTFYSYVN